MKLAVISCLLLKITFIETWKEMNLHLQSRWTRKVAVAGQMSPWGRGPGSLSLCCLFSARPCNQIEKRCPKALTGLKRFPGADSTRIWGLAMAAAFISASVLGLACGQSLALQVDPVLVQMTNQGLHFERCKEAPFVTAH